MSKHGQNHNEQNPLDTMERNDTRTPQEVLESAEAVKGRLQHSEVEGLVEAKFTKEYFVNTLGEAVREMHKWDNPFLCEEKAREWMASAYDTIVTSHHQKSIEAVVAKLESRKRKLFVKGTPGTSYLNAAIPPYNQALDDAITIIRDTLKS